MNGITDEHLREARIAHARKHGHPSARAIDGRFGVDGDDGLQFERAKGDRRTLLLSAYRGEAATATDGDGEATPLRSFADLDTAGIYAKFNAPGRKAAEDV